VETDGWHKLMTEAVQKADWSDNGFSMTYLSNGDEGYWITVSKHSPDAYGHLATSLPETVG